MKKVKRQNEKVKSKAPLSGNLNIAVATPNFCLLVFEF